MNIRLLAPSEHVRTRKLYEQVFSEDTKEFVDYYYDHVTDHNQIWIMEDEEKQEIVSMLHLNPYQIHLGTKVCETNYIVAVATRESDRGQGNMRALLKASLNQMYEQQIPFTYLMPAAEAIYTPYDFVTVAGQEHYTYTGQMIGMEFEEVVRGSVQEYATEEDCEELAIFANQQLRKEYDVYTLRTEVYFKQILQELECQNGGIVLVKAEGELLGYFLVTNEDEVMIREPIFAKTYDLPLSIKEEPKIMVRIVHVESMLRHMLSKIDADVLLEIYDPILSENTGVYQVKSKSGIVDCQKISGEVDQRSAISIADVARMIFQKEQILLNEIV